MRKPNTTKKVKEQVSEKKFTWTQNVKYRGKRYRRNRPAVILSEDVESLLEAKVIKAVN